ncbi:MAG: carbohydrate kinase [Verrucomicrobia bacterium]|nr:carbohydrate kinase [Verrucomicrobiota bacterium]MCH8512160.1 PfkB family carbohydrate kinase [Kiritimatiellia bacterium]
MSHLSLSRARALLDRFSNHRVLVVGDLMLDRYVHGRVDRISPEAPVPVVKVVREHCVPGGACNVALNIQALGGRASVCGLVGTCIHAEVLMDQLQKAGVDVRPVTADSGVTTVVKTRILADRQQMLRVDRENADMGDKVDSAEFLAKLDAALEKADGMILEDYGKGVLTPSLVRRALDHAKAQGIPSGYDPKDNHELDVAGVTFATPNRKEAFHVAGMRDRNPEREPLEDDDLLRAAQRLRDMWQPLHLMVTLGPQGMFLLSGEAAPQHVSTRAREVFDVSGAGDTVIATTMLALAAGASFREAAELANAAAGIVVAKVGTATTSPAELLAALEQDTGEGAV